MGYWEYLSYQNRASFNIHIHVINILSNYWSSKQWQCEYGSIMPVFILGFEQSNQYRKHLLVCWIRCQNSETLRAAIRWGVPINIDISPPNKKQKGIPTIHCLCFLYIHDDMEKNMFYCLCWNIGDWIFPIWKKMMMFTLLQSPHFAGEIPHLLQHRNNLRFARTVLGIPAFVPGDLVRWTPAGASWGTSLFFWGPELTWLVVGLNPSEKYELVN